MTHALKSSLTRTISKVIIKKHTYSLELTKDPIEYSFQQLQFTIPFINSSINNRKTEVSTIEHKVSFKYDIDSTNKNAICYICVQF